MRRALVESLVELGATDDRVVLLTGDLGFAAIEPFAERFPGRFFNVGVAEQNMVGLATGLAESGFTPYVYSIATFASMRAYEFIRNGPVLHGLPVRVIGIGEGVDYGHNGMTHYALEDVAIMRAQPGLAVVSPAADAQVRPAVQAVQQLPGPAYLRISKQSFTVPGVTPWFELGRAQRLGAGEDVAIVALGSMAATAVASAELLAKSGIGATVVVVSCVSPTPVDDLSEALSCVRLAVSLESHYVTGGLGSMVAELIAEQGLPCRLVRAGVRERLIGTTGTRDYMHRSLRLSAEHICDLVLDSHDALRSALSIDPLSHAL